MKIDNLVQSTNVYAFAFARVCGLSEA